jgi:hypothetical protein
MKRALQSFFLLTFLWICSSGMAQDALDSIKKVHRNPYKNIIRYNISGAMLFGLSEFVILGYERITRTASKFLCESGTGDAP